MAARKFARLREPRSGVTEPADRGALIAPAATRYCATTQSAASTARLATCSRSYKAAAEIGGGDNTASMRHDRRRRPATAGTAATTSGCRARPHPVGERQDHLRASAHPVNAEELHDGGGGCRRPGTRRPGISDPRTPSPTTPSLMLPAVPVGAPYAVGVLSDDVDNHADLKVARRLRFAGPITMTPGDPGDPRPAPRRRHRHQVPCRPFLTPSAHRRRVHARSPPRRRRRARHCPGTAGAAGRASASPRTACRRQRAMRWSRPIAITSTAARPDLRSMQRAGIVAGMRRRAATVPSCPLPRPIWPPPGHHP